MTKQFFHPTYGKGRADESSLHIAQEGIRQSAAITASGLGVYLKAADEFLAARADDPAYVRIWSSLLYAFDGMPKLEKPDTSKPRLFQLRVYESHNERAAAKKVGLL